MSDNLKHKTIHGVIWSSIDRFATQGITFAIGLVMARLLTPEDYGVIAMLAFFLAISQTFIDSGFSSALIRKKDITEVDNSTVFYFNVVIGLLCYAILWFTSPLIASFYDIAILSPILKVVGLTLIFNSLTIIQQTKLTIELDFKTQTIISIISWSIPGCVGLYLAYQGFGPWALAIQMVLSPFLRMICLWLFVKWRPLPVFSKKSFTELFSFGSKLLSVGILNTTYNNLSTLLIGKIFSASSLGYYSRAQQFVGYTTWNIESILQRVTYPVLCSIKEEEERLKLNYRRIIKVSTFIIFPLTLGMAAVAAPLIRFILTDKWDGAIPLLQILSLAGMWFPIHAINLNLLNVKGRSDVVLKIELIKKGIGLTLLCISIPFGLLWFCWSCVLSALISLIINFYFVGKYADIKMKTQITDLLPTLFQSAIMYGVVWLILPLFSTNLGQLLAGVSAGGLTYILLAYLMKSQELKMVFDIVFRKRIV